MRVFVFLMVVLAEKIRLDSSSQHRDSRRSSGSNSDTSSSNSGSVASSHVSGTNLAFEVSHEVPRLEWKPNVPFANEIAKLDQPVILTHTVASTFLAMQRWKPELLAKRLKNQKMRVKTTSDPNGFFHYCHETPFLNVSVVESYTKNCYKKQEMLGKEFFSLLLNDKQNISSASILDSWEEEKKAEHKEHKEQEREERQKGEWLKEIFPIESLIVTSEAKNYSLDKNHLYRQSYVWISSPHTTTPAHFDLSHNFFVQIHGEKHVLLAPPSAWEFLYLYPVLHPGHRSVQVNLTAPDLRAFPHFRPVDTVQAHLKSGDVLYIPPLWFHHITTATTAATTSTSAATTASSITAPENIEHHSSSVHTPSVSLSVWSHYLPTQQLKELLENPLPLLNAWEEEKKWAALRLFLESLFDNLDLGMNVASFLHWTLLENRYRHIATDERDTERWCIIVEGAGTQGANQIYTDRSSGQKGTAPLFVGTQDASFRLKFQKHWILGQNDGEERHTLYQGQGEEISSLYSDYDEALGASPAPFIRPCNDTIRYCFDEELTDIVKEEVGKGLMTKSIEEAVSVFDSIKKYTELEPARLHILLADYFEIVINSVVGPTEVRSFLHDFVYC